MVSPYDIASALVYAYPLALYVQTFYPVLQAKGANVIRNDNNTATASGATLVRPNANYVYSPMAVDLSSDNVVITVPDIDDGRSYVYPFYDLFGNFVAGVGSATNSPPGDYLLRLAEGREPGLTMINHSSALCDHQYQGVIDFATTYGSMELRILLRNNGSDLDAVHRYQRETLVRTIPRHGTPRAPPLTATALGDGSLASAAYATPDALDYGNATMLLDLLAKLAPFNPPQNSSDIPAVDAMLQRAGISNGEYCSGREFNLTVVNAILTKNLSESTLPSNKYGNYFGNGAEIGWWFYKSDVTGNFHDNYLIRAIVAYTGYLQLVQQQAIYPEYINPELSDDEDNLSLSANESLVFTFSGRPPAQFWAVTLYGSNSYLIQNSLGRYALGCTSDSLKFPNGSQVYPTGQHNDQRFLDPKEHAPFQILVQPGDKMPPTNWTGNWIPSQMGGGKLSLNFRAYAPSLGLINGTYVYPVVSRQGLVL